MQLAALLAVFAAALPAPAGDTGGQSDASGSSGGDSASVQVWSGGHQSAHPSRNKPKPKCTAWERVGSAPFVDQDLLDGNVMNGKTYFLYQRTCDGQTYYHWITKEDPRDVANVAYANAVAHAPDPTVALAPPGGQLIVNLETYFAVRPMNFVTATASLPDISATVRLVPVSITFETGSRAAGDTRIVHCKPWGSTSAAKGGCAWTPKFPSLPRFTGGGRAFQATVTVTWSASWTASNGAHGTLADIHTSTDLDLVVREVQTIGGKDGGPSG